VVTHAIVALVPVLLFLAVLLLMDSFKLARPSAIAVAIVCGAAAAFVCDRAYDELVRWIPPPVLSRYVAPAVEETAKAVFIAYAILRRRVGFLVDAAQLGFAVGAGFALIENGQYLRELEEASTVLWLVRGLGTALLHGATTAIFAILSKAASDRRPLRSLLAFAPGWATAVVVHSAFNHVLLPPVLMTGLLLIVLPVLVLMVFERSGRATREWVVAGLDLDLDLLDLVSSDHFGGTRFGTYLRELKARFPGPIVVDMFCLLRVELELAIQAKAMLIARQAGLTAPVHEDACSALAEVEYLRASIGPTGLLTLRPLHVTTHRDEWHRYLLRTRRGARISVSVSR
jgi:RsiW-degrading membrane proteinase PrsW (M82 family)